MASIQDVARHANVGAATVSRVLSGKGYVSKETREKVNASIKALNYVPNELARNLLYNRTNTIAVIVPDISNPFYSIFLNRVEFLLRQQGYKLLLCSSAGQKNNEAAYLDMLERNMVDGVITYSAMLENWQYTSIKRPMVAMDTALAPHIPMVTTDHAMGGRLAAQAMIKAGCRHVLQLRDAVGRTLERMARDDSSYQDISTLDFQFVKRHTEFERVIRAANIQYDEYILNWDTYGVHSISTCVDEILEQFPDIDGFMGTDISALLFARKAMERGRQLPEDVKVVAYDGTSLIQMFYPPISAVVQPIDQLAEEAVRLLLMQINGTPIENNRIILPVTIVDQAPV